MLQAIRNVHQHIHHFFISVVSAHTQRLQSATNTLIEHVSLLLSVLHDMQCGKIPFDPEIVRYVSSVASKLTTAKQSKELNDATSSETCDALLTVLLTACTKGNSSGTYFYYVFLHFDHITRHDVAT